MLKNFFYAASQDEDGDLVTLEAVIIRLLAGN